MDSGAVVALQIATVVFVAAVVVATWCSRDRVGAAAVHDVERALGAATIMTYEQAVAGGTGYGKAQQCCAICLSDYATGDELVRVVPACGHFFHAECGVDAWLRAHRTCPLCRGGLGRCQDRHGRSAHRCRSEQAAPLWADRRLQ